MFNRNIFAERLKALRVEKGESGITLSRDVGLKNRGSIAQFETCRTTPSADILVSLADHFGVSLDYLAGRSDDPRSEEFEPLRQQREQIENTSKEQALLAALPASLLPAYQAAKEKNPENLPQIIETFAKMAKDYHSLTK